MRRLIIATLACAALGVPHLAAAQEADAPTVTWLTEGPDIAIIDGMAFDWVFSYEVVLPGGADPEGDAVLEITRCGGGGRCEKSRLSAVHGTSSIRWGIDASSYHLGRNRYSFTLRLVDNGMVSEDVLEVRVAVSR